MELSLIDRDCSVCESEEKREILAARLPRSGGLDGIHSSYDRRAEGKLWHHRVVRCEHCHHTYSSPVFASDLVETSYTYQGHDNSYGIPKPLLEKTSCDYVRFLSKHLPERRRVFLDIGCDTGLFLKAASTFGFSRYVGVEPSGHSLAHAERVPGVEYIHGYFSPQLLPGEPIDVATMIHVLDHLRNPKSFLKDLHQRLSQGGVFFAVVHGVDSWLARLSGEGWHPYNIIHFDFYSKASLVKLVEAAGFRTVAISETSNHLSLRTIADRMPFLTAALRSRFQRFTDGRLLSRISIRARLGNIGIVAEKA